jgi:hypothetical protein
MTHLRFSAILLACVASIGTVRADDSLPSPISQLIEQRKAEPRANPPASVWRYTYLDQTVFYLPPKCCDVPSALYDSSGKLICRPDGGMTGRGDGKCRNFHQQRTDEQLIWRDER